MTDMKTISVVITAHRYCSELAHTVTNVLESEAKQVVIVTDQRSFDADRFWASVPTDLASEDAITVVPEAHGRGPSYYRNAGIECIDADITLLLDYDCRAPASVVSDHKEGYTSDRIGAVAGVTELVEPNETLFTRATKYSQFTDSYSFAKRSGELEWAPAANLSVRTDLIQELNFDERFPQRGGGEDIDLCWRINNNGYEIAAVPDAVVTHDVWDSFIGVLSRIFRWGRAETTLISKHPDRRASDPSRLFRLMKRVITADPVRLVPILLLFSIAYYSGTQWEKLKTGRWDLLSKKIQFEDP